MNFGRSCCQAASGMGLSRDAGSLVEADVEADELMKQHYCGWLASRCLPIAAGQLRLCPRTRGCNRFRAQTVESRWTRSYWGASWR